MIEALKILIGAVVLFLGIPIGNFLARYTKDEIKQGQQIFRVLVWIGITGGIFGLIIKNDILMFSLFFISIVTSRSVK